MVVDASVRVIATTRGRERVALLDSLAQSASKRRDRSFRSGSLKPSSSMRCSILSATAPSSIPSPCCAGVVARASRVGWAASRRSRTSTRSCKWRADSALALGRQKLLALGADPGPTAENIDLDLELPETGAMATAKQQLDTLGVPYTQKERRSPDKPRLHGDLLDAVHGGAAVQGRQDLFVARLSGIVADLMLSRFWRW
jgi:hypothetical protein